MEKDSSLDVLYKESEGLCSYNEKELELCNISSHGFCKCSMCLKEPLKENSLACYCFSNRLAAIYLDSQMTNHKNSQSRQQVKKG